MRKIKLFSTVLSLFLLVPASITWAQTISSQKGLTTAIFNTPQGNIKVYLPNDIRPGDVISGRIVTEPLGKNDRQIGKNLGELTKYSIGLNNDKFLVDKNKEMFQFLVHPDRELQGPIELLNVNGIKMAELFFPDTKEQKPSSAECLIPSHALTGSPLRITGPFDGNSSNTNCTLYNKPMKILAESPRQCIVFCPDDTGGIHSLNVQETNTEPCTRSVSCVNMDVSAGKLNLKKGERTYIDINITGLQNLPGKAVLTLVNLSSEVVAMLPVNTIIIPLTPDSVGSGTFTKRFIIQSLKTGSYIVYVDLDLPEIQYEEKLQKPRPLENEALHTGLSQAIKKLEADAGGAQGKEYNEVCENCQKCIRALAGKWTEDLVKKLGEDMMKEFVGKAVSMFMESKELLGRLKKLLDKADEAIDNAEKLADEIQKKINAGELQLLVFNDQLCASNQDCVVSAMIFNDPTTGCVTAFVDCKGRVPNCCPNAFTMAKITYCTDERGMPKDMPKVEVIKK